MMNKEELFRFVKENQLEQCFYYNDYGTDPLDVMLYRNDDGTFSAFVNGYERGYRDQTRNVSEYEACNFCQHWLKVGR